MTTGCGGHAGLTAELRAVAVLALDRLGPMLERVGEAGGAAQRGPRSEPVCAVCPVCAVIAVLRGERPELAVRLTEQARGLLTALRAALEECDPATAPGPGEPGPADTRPADTRPADTRPADTRPADTRPADTRPADPGRPGTPLPAPARVVQRIRVDRPVHDRRTGARSRP